MLKKITLFVRFISMNLLLLLLSTFLLPSCSDDNSPTEPESQPSLAEATIGSGGGTLKTDDFELSVPAGAFPTDTKLTLNLIENEDSGFDNVASREFQLEGLPKSFSQPLTIKIKYSGELTDSSFIAVGENVWVNSLASENVSYHLMEARDSSDYLITLIPPKLDEGLLKIGSNISEDEQLTTSVLAISGYSSYISEQKHFKIDFPSSVPTEAIDLASYLETAYSKFKNLGFSYDKRTNWPIEVTVKKLASTVYGYSMNSMWGDNYGYMEFNFDKMSDNENLKVTAGHEFFHLVQSLYDPRNRFSKAKLQSPNFWLYEASSVWSESFFSANADYVPSIFLSNANSVIQGANNSSGDKKKVEAYGYGMSSFIQFIANKFGDEIILKIYEEINKDNNSFTAINNALSEPIFSFYSDYMQEYLSYNIYRGKGFKPRWLSQRAVPNTFLIEKDSDTLKTFSDSYKDLSTQLFYIKVRNDSLNLIDENSQLIFEADGDILSSILLFKENKDECVFIKKDNNNSVALDNFKSITDAGYIIIAAVTNAKLRDPYTEETPGTLTIKVKNKEVDPAPEITEIFDSNLFLNAGIKRHFSIPGKSIIIEGKNFIDDQKVFVNEVEIGSQYWYNNYGNQTRINMPPEIRGHVKIKILTASGESNEFQYLLGLPTDYLNSSDSLSVAFNLIPKANDYLGERIIEPIHLEYSGFSKNEIQWDHNIATVDIGNGDDMTGTIKVTFSDLENSTISKVVIDYAKSDKYNMHYEYAGNDYIGGDEDYYNGPGNSLAVYSNFSYSHSLKQLQPYSVSGSIRVYNPVTSKYYDVEFNELDLSATVSWVPVPENSLIFNLFHFHVD